MWTTTFHSEFIAAPIPLQVFGKQTGGQPLPVLLFFHGGLFDQGSVEDAYPLASALAGEVITVCVDYPLAPALRLPESIEVAFEALTWTLQHAKSLGGDARRMFVMGEQAGGNLAAVIAMLARDRRLCAKQTSLQGQVLINPMLDASQTSLSMGASVNSPCRRAWAAYLPVASDCVHPYASPLYSCRLAGLVPALVVSNHCHPLLDETEAYAAKLMRAGVPVQVQRLQDNASRLTAPLHPSFQDLCRLIRNFVAG